MGRTIKKNMDGGVEKVAKVLLEYMAQDKAEQRCGIFSRFNGGIKT